MGFKGTPMHNSYFGAKQRCNYKNGRQYKDYGGRGIRFLWGSFDEFLRDMAATHFDGATLDRIDTNGDYCKDNCRWVSRTDQARNTRRNIHTVAQVREIKAAYALGVSQVSLAKQYGDSQGNISNIIHGRIWKHVR